MQTVTKQYRTETGHRLMDYDGKCSHLHGHSYLWEVSVECEHLSQNGMVTDFKNLKAAMKRVLEPLDHSMVLHARDPLLSMGALRNGGVESLLRATNGETPRLHVWPVNPTAENFAAWAANEIQREMWEDPDQRDVTVVQVRVWETSTSYADWHKGE